MQKYNKLKISQAWISLNFVYMQKIGFYLFANEPSTTSDETCRQQNSHSSNFPNRQSAARAASPVGTEHFPPVSNHTLLFTSR